MCTVSVVPSRDRLRLICNRDESRTRPDALDPIWRRIGPRTACFPVDPLSGGTWIGLNDAGLALALLNSNTDGNPATGPRQSRGTIIPPLLACKTFEDLVERAHAIVAEDFAAFRLVAIHAGRIAVILGNGRDLSCRTDTINRPVVFTSSSLGDHVVAGPRRALFERMVLRRPANAWLGAQRLFHRHRWPSQPAISVQMTRPDGRTVSRTVIDLSSRNIALHYRPLRQGH